MRMYHGKGPQRPSNQKIYLATPAYSGVTGAYSVALFNAVHALERAGIGCELAVYAGNCHVDDGRNALVKEFLDSDCTDLVFLDADLWFSGKSLVNLVQYHRDVVAGIYPKKQDNEEYPVWLTEGELWTEEDGLLEVRAVPTGFLRISRAAIKAIAGTVPHYGNDTPLIFERSLDNGNRVGGDYEFCRKWRNLGGKIYVDPEMEFSHIGENEWHGSLTSYLLRKNGLTDKYIESMLKRLESGEDVDFTVLRREWGNDFAAQPKFLTSTYLMAQETKGPILECGSGITTLIMGAVTSQPIYVLENELEHAQKIQGWVDKMGWSHVHVYHTPIKDYSSGFKWYETPEDLPEFSLIVCDGPRRDIGRYGLVPVLGIQHPCKVLVDDLETMQSTIDQWGFSYKALDNFAIIEA